MKISVSLSNEDVAYLDTYARTVGHGSRSSAVAAAVRSLRASELEEAYAQAFAEWRDCGEQAAWEDVTGDGLITQPPTGLDVLTVDS